MADLECAFDAKRPYGYDAVELVRYALSWPVDYWTDRALVWLEEGVPASHLTVELRAFEADRSRPQHQRHRARQRRKTAE